MLSSRAGAWGSTSWFHKPGGLRQQFWKNHAKSWQNHATWCLCLHLQACTGLRLCSLALPRHRCQPQGSRRWLPAPWAPCLPRGRGMSPAPPPLRGVGKDSGWFGLQLLKSCSSYRAATYKVQVACYSSAILLTFAGSFE